MICILLFNPRFVKFSLYWVFSVGIFLEAELLIFRNWLQYVKGLAGFVRGLSCYQPYKFEKIILSEQNPIKFWTCSCNSSSCALVDLVLRFIVPLEDFQVKLYWMKTTGCRIYWGCWWALYEVRGRKSAGTGVSNLEIVESWGMKNFTKVELLGKSTIWQTKTKSKFPKR